MMFHRLGLINRNQRGFTLIELMIAIAISGIITGGITMTIFQVINGSARSSNHMTAVRQVQNAGYWVSHDAQMAQSVATGNVTDAGFPFILTWTDSDNVTHTANYTLEDDELWRNYDGERSPVAQFINPDPAQTSCNFTDSELIFTVTATVGTGSQEESETRVYEVVPRPGS